MKKYSKIIGTVVVSSALLSTNIVGMAINNNSNSNSKTIDTTDMKLGIEAKEDGKSVNLSILNASMSNSFQLSLKLKGDVKYKGLEFSKAITSTNGITNVEYDESSKVINILVTSDSDLVKSGVLEIGTLTVEGEDGVEYSINDNVVAGNPTITMVTPTYDEINVSNLDEVGDTTIRIPSEDDNLEEDDDDDDVVDDDEDAGDDQEGEDDQEGDVGGSEDGDNTTDGEDTDEEEDNSNSNGGGTTGGGSNNGGTTGGGTNGGTTGGGTTGGGTTGGGTNNGGTTGGTTDDENKDDNNTDKDEEKPSIDVEVSEGSDGVKIITPNSEQGLKDLLSDILKKDANAKIVSIKEEKDYFIYRIKMKNTTTRTTDSIYIDVKVAKSIKADKGLPGIEMDIQDNGGSNTGNEEGTVVNKAPIIYASDVTMTVGEVFNALEGVSAYDEEDGNITHKLKVKKNEVDELKEGVYEVIYTVEDNNGNVTEKTIKVTVKAKEIVNGKEKPTISAKDKVIELGSKVDLLDGITAYDKEDGDLTDKIVIKESDVDILEEGVYSITYSVKDSDGNETTKTIKVTVIKKSSVNNSDSDTEDKDTTTNNTSNTDKEDKEEVKTNDNGTMYGLTMVGSLLASVAVYLKLKRRD